MLEDEAVTNVIIGSAIEVHRHLGPGLLESAYRRCLVHELLLRDMQVASEVSLDVVYKGLVVPGSYRMDLLVADRVVVEIKAVDQTRPHRSTSLSSSPTFASQAAGRASS